MIFSSLMFIFRFLPVFLVFYYLMPNRYKNYILLIGSLCFYAYGEPKYLILLLSSVLINYFAAIYINRNNGNLFRKRIGLAVALVYDFGMLFFFKYINFAVENINILLKGLTGNPSIPGFSVTLPLGISFYTFAIASYIFDV